MVDDDSQYEIRNVNQQGKNEFVEIDAEVRVENTGNTITINGKSNSSKLTFTLGNGDINTTLPQSYTVNNVTAYNGEYIAGDIGADSAYTFALTLTIPANSLQEIITKEVIVTDNAGNEAICIVHLEAALGTPYLNVTDGDIQLDYKGTPVEIYIDTNVPWKAIQLEDELIPIEYVTFNADKVFESIKIKNTYTIECKFQRGNTSSSMYLYGVISSPHTSTVTAYLASSALWRWGSTSIKYTVMDTDIHTSERSNGKLVFDNGTYTSTNSTFETDYPLVLGGSCNANGSLSKQFIGKVWYFRIKEGDNVLLDWEPRKKTDGEEGFYDNISKTFVSSK